MPYSNLFVGTCGWSFDDWSGSFYPEFTPKEQYLEIYSAHFPAVEVRSTAQKLPSPDSISRWRARTPDEFKFAIVAPHLITHEMGLENVDRELRSFLKLCDLLGGKLGPIVFEFPRDFSIDRLPFMTSFIKLLPHGFAYVIELQGKNWLNAILLDILKDRQIAVAQGDLPWIQRPLVIDTAPTVYIRLRGRKRRDWEKTDRLQSDETAAMNTWAGSAAKSIANHKPVFAFFSNNLEGYAPGSAQRFRDMVVKRLDLEKGN